MSNTFPNVGLGTYSVRIEATKFNAVFNPNCVTRSVCRDIWRESIFQAQQPGSKQYIKTLKSDES